ncbi:single-stranded-DNA-specific exonuclease RecJ [Clostridium formicaceticum]|uniref:Single-stranded-DNA-specific exonuclease RecJ n=1 Tax=Clostridium formicaceticum TaxID=1497 RepID=A0AAC9RJV0_9CLOT|nr:single-stranded-DNA-specific exonuclease RecJ [Clostridium formicaceticum]AOY78379.1 single-stranded-DNA-specific exonuclease RecJ [Clostridium formicaceticum]ARE87431.1 Single-stranded-DNA-specific exonuclease RecJ [Clostridium formicaceticum]
MLKNTKADFKKMSKDLGVSQVLCKLLVNRGIENYEDMKRFLDPGIEVLYDPKDMKDLEKAVQIVTNKILHNKKIQIVGDYDVDGIISTYILYTSLLKCGADVIYEIPDRINDGYGINKKIIENAKNNGVDTIITCDNGISALEQIKYAKDLGLTVIVTDHHDVPFESDDKGNRKFLTSEADAIINPKQIECNYAFKNLCGAGVAFKFIEVLFAMMGMAKQESYRLMEFVAIATVCDVVDLVDENRVFVKNGLEMLQDSQNIGLRALISKTGLEKKKLTVYALGFVMGPCLNASGRLDTAKKGLELLLAGNKEEAQGLAEELYQLNEERKLMTLNGVESTIETIENEGHKKDKVFVLYQPEIHESIAGIIAGRIKDKYNIPTILLTNAEEGVKGSGRSIDKYNMFEELLQCKDLLTKFGGHPMAAGLSLEGSNIKALRERLNRQTVLTEEDLIPKIYIDMPLPLEYVSFDLIEELQRLEPFGKGNSKPLFGEKNIGVKKAIILGAKNHVLKLTIDKNGKTLEGIYFGDIEEFKTTIITKFGEAALEKLLKGAANEITLDILYTPTINEYMGRKSLQLQIQNYR